MLESASYLSFSSTDILYILIHNSTQILRRVNKHCFCLRVEESEAKKPHNTEKLKGESAWTRSRTWNALVPRGF